MEKQTDIIAELGLVGVGLDGPWWQLNGLKRTKTQLRGLLTLCGGQAVAIIIYGTVAGDQAVPSPGHLVPATSAICGSAQEHVISWKEMESGSG